MSFEDIQKLEAMKKEVKSTLEKDATAKAYHKLRVICNRRGGKFKLSEKQFIEVIEDIWIAGEFSGAERILRCLEMDKDLNTRDLCLGEIHIFIMDVYNILKKRWKLRGELDLGDLVDGKYSTRAIEESRGLKQDNQTTSSNSIIQ